MRDAAPRPLCGRGISNSRSVSSRTEPRTSIPERGKLGTAANQAGKPPEGSVSFGENIRAGLPPAGRVPKARSLLHEVEFQFQKAHCRIRRVESSRTGNFKFRSRSEERTASRKARHPRSENSLRNLRGQFQKAHCRIRRVGSSRTGNFKSRSREQGAHRKQESPTFLEARISFTTSKPAHEARLLHHVWSLHFRKCATEVQPRNSLIELRCARKRARVSSSRSVSSRTEP